MEQTDKKQKVTIKTVARDAGVSVAAVSKVLRNAYGVSDPLRQKVLASIDRLGYRPSTAARGMRGRIYTIGLLVVRIGQPLIPDLIDSVSDVLGTENIQTLIGSGRSEPRLETQLIASMADFHMDGLILIAPRIDEDILGPFARKMPMVVIGHHEPEAFTFDTVNCDDFAGARLAIEALIARGHKRIHMLSLAEQPGTESDVFRKREAGYRVAMTAAGLADEIHIARATSHVYANHEDNQIAELLQQEPRPTAVFCWSDIHAVPLLNAAWLKGIRVPEDLSIIGYDNSAIARQPIIGLSSVDQQPRTLGETAANLLLERMENRTEPRHILVAPHLVLRHSVDR